MTIVSPVAELELLGGGRYRTEISVKPIAFQRNGTWRRIQNILGNSGDQNFTIGSDELMQFRVRSNLVGNAPVIHIGHGNEHVRITPLGTNNVSGIVVDNTINYPEAWNNADLKLTIAGHIIKKEIILRTGHPASFSFRLDKKAYSGKIVLHEPYLQKTGKFHVPLTWTKTTQGGKETLTVTLPEGDWDGWVLDPTYTSQPDDTTGYDAMLDSVGNTSNYDNLAWIGRAGSETCRYITKFDLSSIPSTAVFSSAIFSLFYGSEEATTSRTATMYQVLRDWVETQVTWVSWKTSNNWTTAGCGSIGNDRQDTAWAQATMNASAPAANSELQWVFTETGRSELKKIVDGTYNNYGWLIKADTEVHPDFWIFRSSSYGTSAYRPKFVAEYSEASSRKNRITLLGVG